MNLTKLKAIDRTIPQKLYCQLLDILKRQIETGEWKVGSQIPTEERLCIQFNVSKATVRLALSELVSLGYLKKIQGKGTFVRRINPENTITMLMNLGENSLCRNSDFISRIIENKTLKPDKDIRDFLNLSEGEHCLFFSRLIISKGTPLLIQSLFIPYGVSPGFINSENIADISLYEFLENNCNIKIQRLKEMIDVYKINEQDVKFIELQSDLPVLRIRHLFFTHGEIPISLSEIFFRTDIYPRITEFERIRI